MFASEIGCVVSLDKAVFSKQGIALVPVDQVVAHLCAPIVWVFSPSERDRLSSRFGSLKGEGRSGDSGCDHGDDLRGRGNANVVNRPDFVGVVDSGGQTSLLEVRIHA